VKNPQGLESLETAVTCQQNRHVRLQLDVEDCIPKCIIYSSNIITLLYMFRASSTHLQEDIVVHKQHMVPALSIRVLVACRYAARVRTDCRGKVVGRAS